MSQTHSSVSEWMNIYGIYVYGLCKEFDQDGCLGL